MPTQTAFIDFEIVGTRRGVQAMLERVDSALSPVGLASFLHGAVVPYVRKRAQRRFGASGDDVSGPWAPLRPATVEIREHMGFLGSGPINRRTGELEDYITKSEGAVAAGLGAASLTYPKNPPQTQRLKEKVQTAQKGRPHPATQPRPVLALNEEDLSVIMTELAFHVKGWSK